MTKITQTLFLLVLIWNGELSGCYDSNEKGDLNRGSIRKISNNFPIRSEQIKKDKNVIVTNVNAEVEVSAVIQKNDDREMQVLPIIFGGASAASAAVIAVSLYLWMQDLVNTPPPSESTQPSPAPSLSPQPTRVTDQPSDAPNVKPPKPPIIPFFSELVSFLMFITLTSVLYMVGA